MHTFFVPEYIPWSMCRRARAAAVLQERGGSPHAQGNGNGHLLYRLHLGRAVDSAGDIPVCGLPGHHWHPLLDGQLHQQLCAG